MLLSELEFGAFLSHSVRGSDQAAVESQNWMRRLKDERHVGSPPASMSTVVARRLRDSLAEACLGPLFSTGALLVPVPSSRITKPGTLWVPRLLAEALVSVGLGRSWEPCLKRTEWVNKAATSEPTERPSAQRHFETLRACKLLFEPDEIVLVDDIVTRGATLLGAASRLRVAFPGARIRAFAAMRAISDPAEFTHIRDPCLGRIVLQENGGTRRRP